MKRGGVHEIPKVPPGGEPLCGGAPYLVTGVITNLGEQVNKPGRFWWDPDRKRVTEEPRKLGHIHPNLPPDVMNWEVPKNTDPNAP